MKTKIFAIIHTVSFVVLATALAYDFNDNSLQWVILTTSLVGTILFGIYSVFGKEVWVISHGRKADFSRSFRWLATSLVIVIMIGSIANDLGAFPENLNLLKLFCWMTIYLVYLTPNLTHIFRQNIKEIPA